MNTLVVAVKIDYRSGLDEWFYLADGWDVLRATGPQSFKFDQCGTCGFGDWEWEFPVLVCGGCGTHYAPAKRRAEKVIFP